MKRAKRLRHPARKMLLASAAPAGDPVIVPDSPALPEEAPANPESDFEAELARRERLGYLRGRAEAVEAAWVDPSDPSPEALEALAAMGIDPCDASASPFAGRKSVWDPV